MYEDTDEIEVAEESEPVTYLIELFTRIHEALEKLKDLPRQCGGESENERGC